MIEDEIEDVDDDGIPRQVEVTNNSATSVEIPRWVEIPLTLVGILLIVCAFGVVIVVGRAALRWVVSWDWSAASTPLSAQTPVTLIELVIKGFAVVTMTFILLWWFSVLVKDVEARERYEAVGQTLGVGIAIALGLSMIHRFHLSREGEMYLRELAKVAHTFYTKLR